MTHIRTLAAALALATTLQAAPALACTADPLGDFEPSFAGPALPGIDVTCLSVRFDGTNFLLSARTAAPISTAGDSYLVWGIDRGAGVPRLQFVGAPPPIKPDLRFDAVFLPYQANPTQLAIIAPGEMPSFSFPDVEVSYRGNLLRAVLPAALLPSTGFAPRDYRFTVWSHYEPVWTGISTDNTFKADFSSTVRAVVPEPATWAMLILGFGAVGASVRKRWEVQAAA